MEVKTKFVISALGIFVSFFYFAILHEKVTKGKYPIETTNPDGSKTVENEKFTYALSLVFSQCLASYLFAKIVGFIRGANEERGNVDGLTKYYAAAALTYLLAMIATNMSLQWVSYPTQVIGKSAKPIPVMLLGVLIGKKSYAVRKYVCVFLVVVGVGIFMYKDQESGCTNESSFGFGELLLIMSLIMDGLMAGMQELIRVKPSKPSGEQMMMNFNFWSCIYLLIAIAFTGEFFNFVPFVSRHPVALFNILTLSLCACIGQHFIYIMVAGFGPLPVSIVTTTRKFVTVLTSVLLFGNTLIPRQWIAVCIVFSALFLDTYLSRSDKKAASKEAKKPQTKGTYAIG